ncbi:MAG: hypothetical protein IIA70_05070 [Proteobacteria bacterium]|nr:hypothetical protein [Pseudomonadota bacterium]
MARFSGYRPQGVIPATLMAFDDDYAIDEKAARKHLRDCALVPGVTAVTVNGHASEVHACTFEEQRRILEFSLDEVPLSRLKSKWWYVSLPGKSYKTFDRLLAYAAKNNIKVAFNPGSGNLSGPGLRDLRRHLKEITFLVVNEGEAATITGIPFKKEKEVFKKLDELVPGIVAVTSGKKGVTVSDGKFIYKAGIFKNKKVVDRTGAGDAFGSGFVSGLIRKKEKFGKGGPKTENIEYAIRLASANSTSVVEHLGASEGTITKKQFDTLPRFRKLKIMKSRVK